MYWPEEQETLTSRLEVSDISDHGRAREAKGEMVEDLARTWDSYTRDSLTSYDIVLS
jgi:hypothetical protein